EAASLAAPGCLREPAPPPAGLRSEVARGPKRGRPSRIEARATTGEAPAPADSRLPRRSQLAADGLRARPPRGDSLALSRSKKSDPCAFSGAAHVEAMTSAVLLGASSGALHAVTGPDHVLSLGPLMLGRPPAPWRIGLSWGAGHALGTLLLALPVVWFTQSVHLPWLAALGDRLAGLALIATAAWSFFHGRAHT